MLLYRVKDAGKGFYGFRGDKRRSLMGTISEPKDIANAVVYLTEASHVTGEVLHVDDGAHVGRW